MAEKFLELLIYKCSKNLLNLLYLISFNFIGIKEDLEDMRLEAEEKKRKAEREKMKKKQRR
jgi:hypothetical protein